MFRLGTKHAIYYVFLKKINNFNKYKQLFAFSNS